MWHMASPQLSKLSQAFRLVYTCVSHASVLYICNCLCLSCFFLDGIYSIMCHCLPLSWPSPMFCQFPLPSVHTMFPISILIINCVKKVLSNNAQHNAEGLLWFQTVRFKNELERNITIKLGYANAKVSKCPFRV